MSKDELRAAMPITAEIIDYYRGFLADGGKLIFASENGHTIDRREPVSESQVFVIPPGYLKPMEAKKK
jgi:hypothetical protein